MSFKPSIQNIANPGELTITQAIEYKGHDWNKLTLTAKNMKRALPVIGVSILAAVFLQPLVCKMARSNVFGNDNKGGDVLDLKTRFTGDDIEYTREFQKMRYLTRSLLDKQKAPIETEQFLINHGENVTVYQTDVSIEKKAPHHKYF